MLKNISVRFGFRNFSILSCSWGKCYRIMAILLLSMASCLHITVFLPMAMDDSNICYAHVLMLSKAMPTLFLEHNMLLRNLIRDIILSL